MLLMGYAIFWLARKLQKVERQHDCCRKELAEQLRAELRTLRDARALLETFAEMEEQRKRQILQVLEGGLSKKKTSQN